MKKYVPAPKSTHAKVRNARVRLRNALKMSQQESKTLMDFKWMVKIED